MLRFACDYQEGCIPEILERLNDVNLEASPGYGEDEYCRRARDVVREAVGNPEARVMFFIGGTQTNSIVIHGLLRSYEGVLSAETGHVCGHEAGAVEAKGHKVLVLPQKEGKITAESIRRYMNGWRADESRTHIVKPSMVYVSQPTEYGTLYSKAELEAISAVCREENLYLYVDGARLAYALGSPENDVTLKDLARLADVFYIGGTKCGALLGEALVVNPREVLPELFTLMKQQGAVLAKGRLLGISFETLLTDGRYEALGRRAVALAQRLQDAFVEHGYELAMRSPTNQIFVVMTKKERDRLRQWAAFETWETRPDGRVVCRFVTSWATPEAAVEEITKRL